MSRPLTVLTVAYPFAPVGPDTAGGAEQIAARIDVGLMRARHVSIVLACDGSRPAGRHVCVPRPPTILDRDTRAAHYVRMREAVAWAVTRWPVDVVHYHGVDFMEYLPPPGPAVLVTLHLPPDWYPAAAWSPSRRDTFLTCVSAAQAGRCPRSSAMLEPVANGVPVDAYVAGIARRRGAVALGRICPEKGVHIALDAARAADIDLTIAGAVYPYAEHVAYFQGEIAPRLDERRRFIGPVGLRQKRRLLARARYLVLPSLAAETSSLVAMEALASGTPVVASSAGALPTIIDHERTGLIVNGPDALAAALGDTRPWSAATCRTVARERFDDATMLAAYVDLYRHLAPVRSVAMHHPGRQPNTGSASSTSRPKSSHGTSGARTVDLGPSITAAMSHDRRVLDDVRVEWDQLYARCPDSSPFLSPEWITAWWDCFGSGEPWVVTVRARDMLVGVLPLYATASDEGPALRAIGTAVGDYADLLADPAQGVDTARAVLGALSESAGVWSTLDLQDVPEASPLAGEVAQQWPATHVEESAICPVVDLPGSFDEFLSSLRGPRRRKLERAWRRLDRLGDVRIDPAGPGTATGLLDALIRLHTVRWNERGLPGVLADPCAQSFHHTVTDRFLRRGWLRLWGLVQGDRVIGVFYGYQRGRRAYAYLGGFDPAFADVSPGSVLAAHAIADAIAAGCRSFDFLRGQEAYKYAWGARDTRTVGFRVRSMELESEPLHAP